MYIPPPQTRIIDIATVSLTGFRKIARKERHLHEAATTFAIRGADIDAILDSQDQDRILDIPEEYQEFVTLFSEAGANKLPPHQPSDHKIQLREGMTPSFGPLYSLSEQELEALRK